LPKWCFALDHWQRIVELAKMHAMPASPRSSPSAAPLPTAAASRRWGPLELGIALFAVLHLGLALLMAVSAHTFFTAIGPFGAYNDHYIHDVATFYAALGAGLAVSLVRPSWRVPVLAVTAIQYGLHSINHLMDIAGAHPAWTGYFDFFSLALATALLIWLLAAAHRQQRAGSPASPRSQGGI